MYTTACENFYDLIVNVGGGERGNLGKIHGMGCAINDKYIVTAHHVWSAVKEKYKYPVILRHDGIFQCDIVIASPESEYDIMILKIGNKLQAHNLKAPKMYPQIYSDSPKKGLGVGLFAKLHLKESNMKDSSYSAFSQGYVSFNIMENDKYPRFVLSGGIIEAGTSGGAVFTAKSELVGIIVQSLQFIANSSHPTPQVVTVPTFSPLFPFKEIINKLP